MKTLSERLVATKGPIYSAEGMTYLSVTLGSLSRNSARDLLLSYLNMFDVDYAYDELDEASELLLTKVIETGFMCYFGVES